MTSSPDAPPLLSMRHVSKTYPGVRALTDVQLEVRAGEVHALMGENGAGKSTLMKVLAGATPADPGAEIAVAGRVVSIGGPTGARALGIAIIYQELALAANLTVAENIHLGREPGRGGLVDRAAMREGCRDVLARLGAPFGPDTPVASLSIAERQMVEIARALHARSRILVMDEPTTALSAREQRKLFTLIARLKAPDGDRPGLAIIYISHRMAEVYELADRVSVLRDGRYVGTLERAAATPEAIVRMMVGRDLSSFYKKEHASAARGEVVLEVSGLTDGGRVRPCSLALRAGEVLGLAGLVGAGRTELARLIYGADPRRAGHVRLAGSPADFATPAQAIDAGLVYLTEDRKAQGLFLDMTVSENVTLGVIGRDAHPGGLLDLSRARTRVRTAIAALGIRVAGPHVAVGTLSGGNQQKVLLSRLLETRPRVLILDEPTRGVDVGAKSEIYRIVDQLAREGAAILVISSELPEVVGICDRVLVMREGEIAGEIVPPLTEEAIMALATGVALQAAA